MGLKYQMLSTTGPNLDSSRCGGKTKPKPDSIHCFQLLSDNTMSTVYNTFCPNTFKYWSINLLRQWYNHAFDIYFTWNKGEKKTALCVKIVVRLCPGAGSGTARLLCEERPGLSHAGHSWLQWAQHGARLDPAPKMGHLGETYLRKVQNAAWQWKVRNKVQEKTVGTNIREGGGGAPGAAAEPPSTPCGQPTLEQWKSLRR